MKTLFRLLNISLIASITFVALAFAAPDADASKKFMLSGTLRYTGGTSKTFSWELRYYPRTGLCFGETYDRDGKALFNGPCNPYTGRVELRKSFSPRKGRPDFYYIGYIRTGGASGVAREGHKAGRIYATWTARVVWSNQPAPVAPPPVAPPPAPAGVKRFLLSGTLRYTNGAPSKTFSWNLRYYPATGLCMGETHDRDGKALFNGPCNPYTGRMELRKRFTPRKGRPLFFYTGYVNKGGASGVARQHSANGRIYANWTARIVWSNN